MNASEAKFILESCKPADLATPDPKLAEALRLVEQDPALLEWWRENQSLDASVSSRLREVATPTDLLGRILAGQDNPRDNPLRTRRQWLRAAAALTVLGSVGAIYSLTSRRLTIEVFRSEMAEFMDQEWDHSLDLTESRVDDVRDWLRTRPQAMDLALRGKLGGLPTYGCKLLTWRGAQVALICFRPTNPGSVVHILAVDHPGIKPKPVSSPQFAEVPPWSTAMWPDATRAYLVLSSSGMEELKQLLA